MLSKTLLKEVQFKTSRSGGAGGQHVNKVETKVQLLFDVQNSKILTDTQKALINDRLGRKINGEGKLLLWSSATRSQIKNKELVIKRFEKLIEKALTPAKKRKRTKVPDAVKKKRLNDKKYRSELKNSRKKPKGY